MSKSGTESARRLLLKQESVCLFCKCYASRGIWLVPTGLIASKRCPLGTNDTNDNQAPCTSVVQRTICTDELKCMARKMVIRTDPSRWWVTTLDQSHRPLMATAMSINCTHMHSIPEQMPVCESNEGKYFFSDYHVTQFLTCPFLLLSSFRPSSIPELSPRRTLHRGHSLGLTPGSISELPNTCRPAPSNFPVMHSFFPADPPADYPVERSADPKAVQMFLFRRSSRRSFSCRPEFFINIFHYLSPGFIANQLPARYNCWLELLPAHNLRSLRPHSTIHKGFFADPLPLLFGR